uniref:Uncharacterized protein n=1 Tax=Melopsittacus undulatus TaxID=13146 RepID=A0A8V5GT02_MELUD
GHGTGHAQHRSRPVAPVSPDATVPISPQTGEPVQALLRRLRALQGERAEAYRLLEQGHSAYLRSAPHYDFPRYRQLVHEITVAFSSISREVLSITGCLQDELARPDLAQHLVLLQEREQEKLQLRPLWGQEPPLPTFPPLWLIKTIEAISEILQDLKYDSEEAE